MPCAMIGWRKSWKGDQGQKQTQVGAEGSTWERLMESHSLLGVQDKFFLWSPCAGIQVRPPT